MSKSLRGHVFLAKTSQLERKESKVGPSHTRALGTIMNMVNFNWEQGSRGKNAREQGKGQEQLREHPSENHAVLKYESTSTLSDFVQILCRVTL